MAFSKLMHKFLYLAGLGTEGPFRCLTEQNGEGRIPPGPALHPGKCRSFSPSGYIVEAFKTINCSLLYNLDKSSRSDSDE
jgi:hypothetical protein